MTAIPPDPARQRATAEEEARARARANPRRRIASGVAGALLLLAALWADVYFRQGWCLAAMVALASVAGLRELFALARSRGFEPFAGIAYVVAPLYILALEWSWRHAARAAADPAAAVRLWTADPSVAVALAGALAVGAAQLARKSTDGALGNVAVTFLGLGYLTLLPGCFVRLRHLSLPNPWGLDWATTGMEFVFVAVFVTKMADIGALLVGKRFGKHKMIPRLSPGKTWEGAAGGLLGSVLFMAALLACEPAMALHALGWPLALGLAVWLTLAGMGGDLLESAFKRDCRAKDAGSSVPGFGGVLDLIDSLIVAGPAMYLFLVACGARG